MLESMIPWILERFGLPVSIGYVLLFLLRNLNKVERQVYIEFAERFVEMWTNIPRRFNSERVRAAEGYEAALSLLAYGDVSKAKISVAQRRADMTKAKAEIHAVVRAAAGFLEDFGCLLVDGAFILIPFLAALLSAWRKGVNPPKPKPAG